MPCEKCNCSGLVPSEYSDKIFVPCSCPSGQYIKAEAQWIDTMHAMVNDAYTQIDEGEITQEEAAAIIREAIALDPTNKG